jgi:hypothetical protein
MIMERDAAVDSFGGARPISATMFAMEWPSQLCSCDSVAGLRDLLAYGVTRQQIRTALESRRWQRPFPA